MQFANANGERVMPSSTGQRAKCPCCGGEVIAKCGDLIARHWAHRANDCDAWSEPESEWHRFWKSAAAPSDRQEVVIGEHRADAMTECGIVIEIQRSHISVESIHERESFYTKHAQGLVWVLSQERARSRAFKFAKCPIMVAGPHDAVEPSFIVRGTDCPLASRGLASACATSWRAHAEKKALEEEAKRLALEERDRREQDERRAREQKDREWWAWERERHSAALAAVSALSKKHLCSAEMARHMLMVNEVRAQWNGPAHDERLTTFERQWLRRFLDEMVATLRAGASPTKTQSAILDEFHHLFTMNRVPRMAGGPGRVWLDGDRFAPSQLAEPNARPTRAAATYTGSSDEEVEEGKDL